MIEGRTTCLLGIVGHSISALRRGASDHEDSDVDHLILSFRPIKAMKASRNILKNWYCPVGFQRSELRLTKHSHIPGSQGLELFDFDGGFLELAPSRSL